MVKRPFFQKQSPDHPEQSTNLYTLREKILLRILTGAIPLGLIAYISALPERIQEKNWGVVATFTLALSTLIVIALFRKIPYKLRASLFLMVLGVWE